MTGIYEHLTFLCAATGGGMQSESYMTYGAVQHRNQGALKYSSGSLNIDLIFIHLCPAPGIALASTLGLKWWDHRTGLELPGDHCCPVKIPVLEPWFGVGSVRFLSCHLSSCIGFDFLRNRCSSPWLCQKLHLFHSKANFWHPSLSISFHLDE